MEKKRSDRSEPTTPISTSSRPPNECDEVMGITQVDSREAERFEEGIEPEFQDVEEELPKVSDDRSDKGHVSGTSHGGFGSSSLQVCLEDSSNPQHQPKLSGNEFLSCNGIGHVIKIFRN